MTPKIKQNFCNMKKIFFSNQKNTQKATTTTKSVQNTYRTRAINIIKASR